MYLLGNKPLDIFHKNIESIRESLEIHNLEPISLSSEKSVYYDSRTKNFISLFAFDYERRQVRNWLLARTKYFDTRRIPEFKHTTNTIIVPKLSPFSSDSFCEILDLDDVAESNAVCDYSSLFIDKLLRLLELMKVDDSFREDLLDTVLDVPLAFQHGDLNFNNLMVDSFGKLKFIDWDWAGLYPYFWDTLCLCTDLELRNNMLYKGYEQILIERIGNKKYRLLREFRCMQFELFRPKM